MRTRSPPRRRARITSPGGWKKRAGGEFATIAVSGGSTPKLLFEQMVALKLNWDRVHLFWVDERGVRRGEPVAVLGA